MIERRDFLFRRSKSAPQNMCYRLEYTRYRNKLNKRINCAKNQYRRELIEKCNMDLRKMWCHKNQWLGRTKISTDDVVLQHLGTGTSVEKICENFSNTFTQEIENIKHQCNCKFLDRASYAIQSNVSIRYKKVTANQVGEEVCIKTGVPTGSVYGPVGYIMHVNSLIHVIKYCTVFMYADDMCILLQVRTKRNSGKIQTDFDSIVKWSHDNGIIINIAKTKGMHMSSPHYSCVDLEFVEKFKYLGLVTDRSVSWKSHIEQICNKLRSVLSKFYLLKYNVPKSLLYTVYFALVDSYLQYGLIAYGRTFKTYLDKLKKLQIRFLKILANPKVKKQCRDNYDRLFAICKVIPIHHQFKITFATFDKYYSMLVKALEDSKGTISRRKPKLVVTLNNSVPRTQTRGLQQSGAWTAGAGVEANLVPGLLLIRA
ncbi:reverse transcriptase (RNA-dependent DNA polymerase) domain-containing protein [Phthorimaea operculella]|nr:reverse transcriptase (RNA-dependent DNA polymerase) domain-containing protein [Phthorimaea operculella]